MALKPAAEEQAPGCRHPVLLGHCLPGSTPISDPTDGSAVRMEERYRRGKPLHVHARDENGQPIIAIAEAPSNLQ
jgi:hypothetical protein